MFETMAQLGLFIDVIKRQFECFNGFKHINNKWQLNTILYIMNTN